MSGIIWIRKGIAGGLVMGMALWNAAIPALAQIEPHVIDQCRDAIANDPTIAPDVRDCCLTEVLPRVEEASTEGDTASPEAKAELRVVETTAVAIHEAAGTTPIELDSPEAVETALKAHFEGVFRASMEGGVGVPPQEVMEKMMGQMAACGIDPGDVFRGVGEIPEPPQAVLDAMTPDQRVGYEAWKSGDFATLEKMHMEAAMVAGHEAMEKYGMSPEMVAKEMATMEAHMKEMATMDPRSETSGSVETTFATHGVTGSVAPAPSAGTTEVLVASHDHLPAGIGDGINDEFHYDTNGDSVADHAHTVPH